MFIFQAFLTPTVAIIVYMPLILVPVALIAFMVWQIRKLNRIDERHRYSGKIERQIGFCKHSHSSFLICCDVLVGECKNAINIMGVVMSCRKRHAT